MASNRQKRKRRRAQSLPPKRGQSTSSDPIGARGTRSELKDAEARAALVPLAEGERPGAVTVGAIVAAAIGLVNLGSYIGGLEVDGERPALIGVLAFSGLMLAAAWGMWHARYWAVLGIQALLALLIIILSLVLFTAETIWGALLLLAIIGAAGTLFWFMVKALARIQMPVRDQ